jgi:sortase (surface protein transpeptidase)
MSAAVIRDDQAQSMLSPAAAGMPQHDGAIPSELAVGDRIIVMTASGNSRAYRVAGPKVVDPHLAEDGSSAQSGDATGNTCVPLDPSVAGPLRLIIEAITADPPAPAPDEEQKL